jgi:hypothetical protein
MADEESGPLQNGWPATWAALTDAQLEKAARDYIWFSQVSPKSNADRRDEIIAEAERRGKPEILQYAQDALKRPHKPARHKRRNLGW